MTIQSGSIKKIAFLAVLIALTALFIGGYLVMNRDRTQGNMANDDNKDNKIITSGDLAPDFLLHKLDGGAVSLANLRGKVVMVHFWATWCPPCVEEIPTLDKLNRSLMGKDFLMLAVNEDEDGAGNVAAFIQHNRLNIPVLPDPGSNVARLYGTYKLPETYIVDREGRVRYKAIGPRDWTDPANLQIVQNIIEAR
jgi:peroxiredoxin